MKVCILGDVVGKSGRMAVKHFLDYKKNDFDLIIVNGENSAHGFGINSKIVQFFFESGVDIITLGNHAWDQKEFFYFIQNSPAKERIARPLNFPTFHPGNGFCIFNNNILIINLISMNLGSYAIEDPFISIDNFLRLDFVKRFKNIIVDFHAEMTSEKNAMGHFLNGRVSAVVGTHTHVQTADAQILDLGTAYITDLGMCGDHNSVIGFNKEASINRFLKIVDGNNKIDPAEGHGKVSGIFFDLNDLGRASNINSFIL